ncbi:hypothetical protein Rsub_05515 [Raphidocelis subcapitata]|uniref:Intraflagellar transport 52 n=1 Tax=Raphidocelis subcapitata TaxID=307507 RepID=A0A2V0P383_9CHLO|nr:hypothetical protein Rsub_05515 [Raphidocelis subcapitata]|eukprot:GBF92313.1 hypothetical protein Rsub_05515 [Raphidocelis subcapitata]
MRDRPPSGAGRREPSARQHGGGGQPEAPPSSARVLFSCCKGETHTHRAGFKQLFRRLRAAYRPEKLEAAADLHPEVLLGPGGASPAVLVLGCPTQRFTSAECDALARLVAGGGGLLVMLREGGEAGAGTNLNYVLEQLGVAANPDSVLRAAHHKYMHPKEAFVTDGVLNRSVLQDGGGAAVASPDPSGKPRGSKAGGVSGGLAFVYPRGCTLAVQPPAVPLLSSGRVCYPMQRPLAAAWEAQPGGGGGRVLVLGSAAVFDDAWLDREGNARLADWAFKWLRPGSRLALHPGDAGAPDLGEPHLTPDTEALADRPKPCLGELRPPPRDAARLFDPALYGFDLSLVPEAVALYPALGVPKAPLGLIPPSFEQPLPPLAAAAFPPAAREPGAPELELFDLDEAFASTQSQLAVVFNRCLAGGGASQQQQQQQQQQQAGGGPDLEGFLLEAAAVCGLDAAPEEGAKGVLAQLLRQLLRYRTLGAAGSGGDGADGGALAGAFGSGGGGGSPLAAGRRITGGSRGGLGSAGSAGGSGW